MKLNDVRIPLKKVLSVGILPSPLKKLFYRMRGYKIGKGVSFGPGSVLDISGECVIGDGTSFGAGSIVVGETARFGKRSEIRALTLMLVPHIEIGNDVVISETAIIRAQQPFPDSRLTIGDRAHIFPYSIIDPSRPLTIGDESAVGFGTYIFTHGAYKDKLAGYPVTYGEVKIGKAVWLPCRVFVMPGVELGDDVVVGSCSVVTSSFPAGSFVLGEPAKLIKTREEFVTEYTPEQRMDILRDILGEFGHYVEHFGGVQVERQPDLLVIRDGNEVTRNHLHRELPTSAETTPQEIHLVLEGIDPRERVRLEGGGAAWFSHADHCCSERLGETAVAWKEYLNRYGITFARP